MYSGKSIFNLPSVACLLACCRFNSGMNMKRTQPENSIACPNPALQCALLSLLKIIQILFYRWYQLYSPTSWRTEASKITHLSFPLKEVSVHSTIRGRDSLILLLRTCVLPAVCYYFCRKGLLLWGEASEVVLFRMHFCAQACFIHQV